MHTSHGLGHCLRENKMCNALICNCFEQKSNIQHINNLPAIHGRWHKPKKCTLLLLLWTCKYIHPSLHDPSPHVNYLVCHVVLCQCNCLQVWHAKVRYWSNRRSCLINNYFLKYQITFHLSYTYLLKCNLLQVRYRN